MTTTANTAPKTIKVTVSMTLTIDPEAWDLAYGNGTDRKAVTEDVRSHMLNLAQGMTAAEEGGLLEVVRKL